MTELHHFHPARKGSGSLRPFPIYPLYTQAEILSLDKPIADCFLFRPRKSRKSAGNAVIPTFPTHWSHGLQHLRHKRRNARFKRLRRVHTHLRQQDRTQRITGRNRGVSDGGWYHYPRSVLRGSETLRGRVSERRTLPLSDLGRGESRRTQRACGTAMRSLRVAVPRRRGPAGLRDLFRFCRNCGLYILRSGFLRVRGMGGITTLSALYVLLKRRTAACQNGSFAVF